MKHSITASQPFLLACDPTTVRTALFSVGCMSDDSDIFYTYVAR